MRSDALERIMLKLPRYIEDLNGRRAFLGLNCTVYPNEWYAGYFTPGVNMVACNYVAQGRTPFEAVYELKELVEFYDRLAIGWGERPEKLDGPLARE